MVYRLLLASLVGMCAVSEAAAQAAAVGDSFSDLAGRPTITVVDESGRETKGRLLLFTPDALTMAVNGQDIVFDRQKLSAVYAHGNSVKKGMIIGVLSGPALLAAAAISGDSIDEAYAIAGAVIFSAIGFGVGTAIDAMIPGHSLVYAAAAGSGDLSRLGGGRVITIVEDSGHETKGRLLSLADNDLTIAVSGGTRSFARPGIAAIFEEGDGLKNGQVIGLAAGAVVGMASGFGATTCGDLWQVRPCSMNDKVKLGMVGAAVLGAIGTGLGAGIDALIPGQRLLYRKAKPAGSTTVSIAPSLSPSRLGLMTSVSW